MVQILVQSNYELVSSVLALEATEPVPELTTQMAVELINNHFSTIQEMIAKAKFFFMHKPQQTFFEMMLKCC